MMTLDEIRLQAQAVDRLAAEAEGEIAADYREMALRWRILEVQAVFMEAMRPPED